MDFIQIILIATSGAIFVAVIELIRRNHLKEGYSLIWLAASVVLIVFSVWRKILHFIAGLLGIYYPPSLLFLFAIMFLIILLLHFSVIVSSLSKDKKRLAQEIGIIKAMIEDIHRRGDRKDS